MSEPNAKPIIPSRHMTKDELRELESAPKTPFQIFMDRLVCFSPVIAGALLSPSIT